MNFISILEKGVAVELKYCERCGGLWLRLQGESEIYCMSCRLRMAEMPRLPCPTPEDLQGQVQIEYLQAVTEPEVRA